MQEIPDEVWQRHVDGRLSPDNPGQQDYTFGMAVGQQPRLLVFLRHLG